MFKDLHFLNHNYFLFVDKYKNVYYLLATSNKNNLVSRVSTIIDIDDVL